MNTSLLLEVVEGKLLNEGIKRKIKDIKIDSKKINKGDVFIALKGNNYDGHDYIKDALKRKTSAIIVSKKVDIKTKVPIILVDNTYDSLIKIGTFYRSKYDTLVIGITGSIGKTTTKEIVSDILSHKYKVLKSEKNYNNHIGIPLTLTKLNNTYDICVLEMGMNHLGEISKLSKMIKPNIGVITNIGTSHIGNLGSKKNILKAKMEIVDGISDGVLLLNNKDKLLKKVKYSKKIKYKLKPYDIKVSDKVYFKLKINGTKHQFSINTLNKDLIMNFIIAIKIGLLLNVDIEDIKKSLIDYQMPNNRMNVIMKNKTKIINDCYNASLESTVSSLNVLKKEKNKKIVILGDILELGKYSIKIHKKIGKHLKKIKDIDVILVGENIKVIKDKNYKYFNNYEEVINYIKKINLDNATILVKASRKMNLDKIVDYILEY